MTQSELLSMIATIISVAVGIILTLGKTTIAQREAEINRRLGEVDKKMDKLEKVDERLHIEEKSTIRQDGEIRLVAQNHNTLQKDIEEIKRDMATRTDMERMTRSIERIESAIGRSTYGRPTPGAYQGLGSGTEPPVVKR